MSSQLLREAADRLDVRVAGVVADDPMSAYVKEWEALAVWLRSAADEHDEDDCYRLPPPGGCYEARHALTVARAVLGRDA